MNLIVTIVDRMIRTINASDGELSINKGALTEIETGSIDSIRDRIIDKVDNIEMLGNFIQERQEK